jgi:RNA polymerase sigma-70 factor, ECF subfamily
VSLVKIREEPRGEQTTARPISVDEAFRVYARYVAAIGLRMLGRPDEVDDLVQDVFVEAQKGFRSIREPEGVKRWLGRVAVRVAHRRLQRRRRWSFVSVHVLGTEYDYSVLPDTGASPETRALLARVYLALDALPAEQRIAWALRHVQGERLDEVALMCDCSLATAKRRIAAAHAAILEAVGDG